MADNFEEVLTEHLLFFCVRRAAGRGRDEGIPEGCNEQMAEAGAFSRELGA